jgi:two-component system phosphate regulon response regulator OmpR
MTPEERRERHLLVVDDDDRIRKLLKEFLVRAGFRVSTAADAAGADRLCGSLDFDLMVLDVMMPGEDGFAFTKRLRAMGGDVGKTPILMLTARDQAADRIEGLTHGVDDYLGKPFEPQELLLRIEAVVALMRRLARAAHEPVDRLELARDTADATGRAVDVQVTRLRRKIEPDPKNPRYLQTVRGIGYRLAPD